MVISPHRDSLPAVIKRLMFVLVHGNFFSSGFPASSKQMSDIMLFHGDFFLGIVSAVIVIVGREWKTAFFS